MKVQKPSPYYTQVENKLKYWSKQLQDLSGRNRLLYYRPTRSSSARIEQPEFLDLFQLLVVKGRELTVPQPRPNEMSLTLDEEVPADTGLDELGIEEAAQQDPTDEVKTSDPPDADPASQMTPTPARPRLARKTARPLRPDEIQSDQPVAQLNRIMYNLRHMARTAEEEQGLNILYVTFGMLRWKETYDYGYSHAPLILVPVEIDRESPNSPYRLRMAEEDLLVNPVLQIKLSKDFGFTLPEIANDVSKRAFVDYLSEVEKEIRRFDGWELAQQASIGVFNFLTLQLVRDFEKHASLYSENPFVQLLSGVRGALIPMPPSVPNATELDDLVDTDNVFQVLDADSSQQEAIEAAKRGLSFVLQGPPGTGKSQTIANIIAESIVAGKKVLFVSQKMAALEVVRNRLASRGLQEFCLEIHSHKMDKRKVVSDLMSSLSHSALQVRNPDYQMQRKELKLIRDELNTYVRQLHEPHAALRLSLYQAQGALAQLLEAPRLSFSVPDLESINAGGLSKRLALVQELSGFRELIQAFPQSRWKGFSSSDTSLGLREKVEAVFDAAWPALEALHQRMSEIASALQIRLPRTIQDDLDYLVLFAGFETQIIAEDLEDLVERYRNPDRSIKRYFDAQYRQDAARLRQLYRKGSAPSADEISRALEVVSQIHAERKQHSVAVNVDHSVPIGDIPGLTENARRITEAFDLARSLFNDTDWPDLVQKGFKQTPAEAADWFADHADHADEIVEIAMFNVVRGECAANGLASFAAHALQSSLAPEDWKSSFARRFYELFIESVLSRRPLLQKFRGTTQNELVRRFRALDLAMIDNSSREIRARLYKDKPQWSWMEAGSAETAILRREHSKKRRLRPLRKLLQEIPNLVQILKPCMMMSPLTVCQLLDPAVYQFDLAVFDEASQIPPEYAVSAFLRARQVIVAGDSQQLPPTNFFQSMETNEYYDDNDAEDSGFESILNACDSCGFPSKMLNWHYRSRDESLIAYSNFHFYDNRLFTFPNPMLNNPALGLKYVFVEEGRYKTGEGARYNLAEAGRVAELVREHLEATPELSLGIVAFSIPQRRAIEAEIDKLRIANPVLNQHFAYERGEPIFIKNLENVQGDERDVIILSVGYARDEAGKMSLNFGPINRDGGARRLNVAVTRARHLLKLVSSIQPEDIDLARAGSQGARLLRSYLEAARDGVTFLARSEPNPAEAEFHSLFEESVYQALVHKGIQLVRQVGVSQYRVDLAVVDPQRPERFLLGIECDGPMYSSASTARDRDRLRHQVLEGLGWRIHRIWSRDWIQNRDKELSKVLHAIDESKAELHGPRPPRVEKQDVVVARDSRPFPVGEELKTPPTAIPYEPSSLVAPELPGRRALLDAPLSQVIDAFQILANTEGPISLRVAKSLVLKTWQARNDKQVDERLDSAIRRGCEQQAFTQNGNFLWPLGKRVAPLRVHTEGQSPRAVADIAPEEMQLALAECIKNSITIGSEDLAREACRLFGLRATRENLSPFETIADQMVQEGILRVENGKLARGDFF